MRPWNRVWMVVAGMALLGGVAMADLQNVEIGGKIETFGGWYSGFYEADGTQVRVPEGRLVLRPIGPNGTESAIRLGDGANSTAWVEQRTRLHIKADFTENVSAFIEVDEIHSWGDNFRSNYLTGVDTRGAANVSLFQGYIDADQLFGQPLRLRIGRQELEFGSGWLVGADPSYNPYTGLSFDAARLTYQQEPFTVDAWWSKLADRSPLEEDGDIDFYGIYATFAKSGGEQAEAPPLVVDLYWLYVRDAQSVHDPLDDAGLIAAARAHGLDNYGVTNLYTVGARTAGAWNALDWEVEVAYQWGNADALGALFPLIGLPFGDNRANWDNWGGHASVGYALDVAWKPRFELGGAFYQGEDDREFDARYAASPFARPNASVSFNRLFSSVREDEFMDVSNMSNLWKAYLEATVAPSEKVELRANVTHLEAFEGFDNPDAAAGKNKDTNIGWIATLAATYQYSDALSFDVVYSHFFTGGGMRNGVFIDEFGTLLVGGLGDDDVDLLYFVTSIEF